MPSRFVLLLLLSTSVTCLVTAVASCSGDTVIRTDASVARDRPVSTEPSTGGGSGGGASGSGGVVGGTAGGAGSDGSGGQAGTGGAGRGGGVSAGSSARGGGAGTRGPDAGSAMAGSSGRVVDAAAAVDRSPGGEVEPLACSDKTSNGRLGVYYCTGSAARTQDVQIRLDLINFTAETARLSQATVRYWFTDEGAGTPNILTVYYSPPALGKVNTRFLPVTPPRTGADTVLEISFTPGPDAGVSFVETTEFNFAFHKDGYSGTFDQSNDYSFDGSLTTTLGPNPKITAYIAGELAWGCEPPVAASSQPDAAEQE